MAKIVGNLVPEDDFTHPLGPEPNFNESMYFNFFDPEQGIGGFVRLGNRANEGRAEMTVCLFMADGRVLFTFNRAPIDDNDGFDAGGLRFEVEEPTERLRTTFSGRLAELKEPRAMADPSRAFEESPRREVQIDLVHTASGPMYGGTKNKDESPEDAKHQFAKAHYEQHMAVKGTIHIDDESLHIDGYGLRDHSWGPRHWQAIKRYEWLTMNFGPNFGAMVSIIARDEDHVRRGGVLVRDGELVLITDAEIDVEYEENGLYHSALNVRLKTHDGETLDIRGDVKGFIPLRNRRGDMMTHIGEGMTEWRCGDQVGYGLSEFLRQVE
jgi:hypothetical protein